MLNIKVHQSTIRERLNKYGLFGRVVGKSLFSKKKTIAQLIFVKFHLNKPKDCSNNVLQTDKTKVEMLSHKVQNHVWKKKKPTYYLCCNITPNINCQHGGGGVMIWVSFAAIGPGHLSAIKYEAICLTARAWSKLSHTTGQWSKALQQIYNKMTEKGKKKNFAITQPKSRLQPRCNAVVQKWISHAS